MKNTVNKLVNYLQIANKNRDGRIRNTATLDVYYLENLVVVHVHHLASGWYLLCYQIGQNRWFLTAIYIDEL